jgi:hypothetical protein
MAPRGCGCMTFPTWGSCGGPWEAGAGTGGETTDTPLDTGEGARVGVVEDGRVHPGPVPVEDDGNLVSLVTRRVWVAGGGGDLAKPFVRMGRER